MARIIGSKQAASQFNELQETEVGHFLLHILERPNALLDHIRRLALQSPVLCTYFGFVVH
jgi:hypothetical protein